MKITRISAAAIAMLVIGGPGFADTIVQTESATLLDVGNSFAVPVEFNEFNPALGTLTSLTVDLTASFSGTVGIENLSNVADVAAGVIAGSVTVATSDNSLSAEVFPSATGPTHNLSPFDGIEDYGGTSGATDSVSGAPASTSVSAPPAAVLPQFTGTGQIFLGLTASTFPLVEGRERESAVETANATATVQLTYDYTPAPSVPEPGTAALLGIGVILLAALRRRLAAAF